MTERFYSNQILERTIILDESESQHCIKVLRFKVGDKINVLNGKGTVYLCRIQEIGKKNVSLEIIKSNHFDRRKSKLSIGISPTKHSDRIEWFIEKAVELGVEEVFFIKTKRTERSRINLDRIFKKAISALKQSNNKYLPKIEGIITLDDFLEKNFDRKLIAHLNTENKTTIEHLIKLSGQHFSFLIGPEGDFTEDEVIKCEQSGYSGISLGESVLRTETAGVYVCSVVSMINQLD